MSENNALEETKDLLKRRGHVTTSWEKLETLKLSTGIETTMFRIGMPHDAASPTVFKVYYPPGCKVEAHTHECDYSEIILEGSQKVGNEWLRPGDIRVGMANRGYGPLVAGEEGATVLVIFADGKWPAVTIGRNDGSSLGVDELLETYGR
ncbi:MAG: hypothetical protein GWM88_10160 [Pseudomonadales bacterium]|nr:hypothetical protein [Pseudomonadales bacterium]NIX08338.1 hypothetical protein [Pseudomonadales bacterium]